MNTPRYSAPAMLLHWAHAILVIYLLWLGWTMIDLPKGAERSAAYGLHKSCGLLVALLLVLRLAWRTRHAPPAPFGTGWQAFIAKTTHHALYAFLLLAPVAGYLASACTPYAVKFFGLELPRITAPDESLNALFKQCHVMLVWGGAALIGLHLLGVLKHLRHGTDLLRRMLPKALLKNETVVPQ